MACVVYAFWIAAKAAALGEKKHVEPPTISPTVPVKRATALFSSGFTPVVVDVLIPSYWVGIITACHVVGVPGNAELPNRFLIEEPMAGSDTESPFRG